jgi:hypothetical protein
MLTNDFRMIVDEALDKKSIDENDVKNMARNVFSDGVASRDQVDVLIALDRAVPVQCIEWGDFLVRNVVDFTVWASRPTGLIDRDAAHWLVTTLSAGDGPTQNAMKIAFEIVREAESCDEALVTFAMRNGEGVKARYSVCERAALVS